MNERMDFETTKTLRRTHIAAHDFERAHEFIEAAAQHGVATLGHEALLACAVVHNSRPFSGNEALCTKNPPSDRFNHVDAAKELGSDLAPHKRILEIRNKAVAHAGWDYYATDRIELVPSTAGVGMQGKWWHIVNEQIGLEAFARIAAHTPRLCRNRMVDIGSYGYSSIEDSERLR